MRGKKRRSAALVLGAVLALFAPAAVAEAAVSGGGCGPYQGTDPADPAFSGMRGKACVSVSGGYIRPDGYVDYAVASPSKLTLCIVHVVLYDKATVRPVVDQSWDCVAAARASTKGVHYVPKPKPYVAGDWSTQLGVSMIYNGKAYFLYAYAPDLHTT